MQPCVNPGFCRLMTSFTVLLPALSPVLALPTEPLSLNLPLLEQNSSSLLAPSYGRPPENPTCPPGPEWGATVGRPSYDDCDHILTNLYPKDPLAKPVLRNFYSRASDVSRTLNNFRLPYEQSFRSCNIQLLLATNFNNVPHDNATWNSLRGATRIIFRTCILGKGVGGVIPRNGEQGNIEIVVYGKNSVFAKNQILKYSQDPLARSIAVQELLELMKIVQPPDPQPTGVEIGNMASQTANATGAGVNVATS